ncbi:MAG: hypothetical protein HUU21_10960 [Polyangiaceae bacterium]|nr:hypothetical protein [Polyangiaceae bacterium]
MQRRHASSLWALLLVRGRRLRLRRPLRARARAATPAAVVDDTRVPHPAWVECRTDNDVSQAVKASCGKPQ